MSIACQTVERPGRVRMHRLVRRNLSRRRRLVYMTVIYVAAIAICLVTAELGFRMAWNPKYWIHTNRLLVGSGQTEAGKKWWPDTRYFVESNEFHTEFRSNAQGYRARPGPSPEGDAYRVAFVGDSFTEGMQVEYESTFCARLEGLLEPPNRSRAIVCENRGVSATDLLEYWHRIHHDVLASDPPDMIVLCIYPGNDFRGVLPDDAFDETGKPLADYFRNPGWAKHVIAWVNLHSKFGSYVQRALLSVGGSRLASASHAPKNWWADPRAAAGSADVPEVRRSRAILSAIDQECQRAGTMLCVLVVGPVFNYVR